MINLILTTDKLDLITSAASTVDVHASWSEAATSGSTTPSTGKTNTAITTATTTDIVAAPASSTTRTLRTLTVRNKDASVANDITIRFNANGTAYELFKGTLLAGQQLEYTDQLGFYVIPTARLDRWLRVTGSDYVNATTSMTDITGLTCPIVNAKTYNFEAHLYNLNNATTTGSQFSINGPAVTTLLITNLQVVTPSVTAAAVSAGTSATRDTASTADTTGATTAHLAIISGYIVPSADGTFAVRGASEVAVAAGLTVKVGSWCHIWEMTG